MSTKNNLLEKEEREEIKNVVQPAEKNNEIEKVEEKKQEEIEKKKEEKLSKEEGKNNNNKTVMDDKDLIEMPKQKEFVPVKDYNVKNKKHSVFFVIILTMVIMLVVIFCTFTIYNYINTDIIEGISIKGIDVSHMSMSDARYKIDNEIASKLPTEIKLKYEDFETAISLEQIEASFDTKKASKMAYNIGRQGNILQNNLAILSTMFGKVNIDLKLTVNEKQLTKTLEDLAPQLPNPVTQSSYYIEGKDLIITSGNTGNVVDVEKTIEEIKNAITNLNCHNTIPIIVKQQEPDAIDIEKIHNEIYKEPKDAYYTKEPFMVYPSENGYDFNISLEEAKNIVTQEAKSEYTIPLKILYPNVTTNMIGTEAFPDLLSTFSTRYSTRDTGRTTNLRLAASKINGTVIMPGETFSYNKVVGERTIAAGYKEAPIYVQGEVVDGLGGGICQITSTLYNAVVYANLEVTERTNHQFVPSYVTASRDATVVYGALDFKFKNNREYPIKLICSVEGGVANFQIFGLKTDNEYEVQISSYETGRTANAIYSEAYKILKQNGQVVSTQLLSKDTYKRH